MSDVKRTVLWSADTVQPNNTTIELIDSIDNYDELIYFGSGTRTYTPCVMTEYPVISGVLNLGGPLFIGKWGSTDNWLLCNGTQVFLSGNSGLVAGSYYWGKVDGGTAYNASLVTNRVNDVRPYKIIGVKYPDNYDRTLIWSSEHTAQLYNTNITLNETVNHFDEIMVLGSGFENGGVGCRHTSKNIYNVQNRIFGCDAWAYTPWKLKEKHNLVIGQEMRLSGNSGYIGSGYFMGMGNQTTAWAAGKWNTDYQFSGTAPYAIYGLKRHPIYNFYGLPSEGGSVSSNLESGYAGDTGTITAIPESDVWKMSALNITGAELTGNDFMFTNSNVTAQAEFEHSRNLTLENGDHGVLSADKMSGFSGDVVTVDATTDEGWYFTGLNITGAIATGNKFTFIGNDVTAEGLYTDEGYPITYLSDEHVSLTGDQIYIPGSEGITLDSGYDTYYRISGYDITGGSIVDGKLVPTGPCTIKAVEKINYFTARGNFNQVTRAPEDWGAGGTGQAYAYAYFTGGENCPPEYYTATYTSYNRGTTNAHASSWNPTGDISGYLFNAASTSVAYVEQRSRWDNGFCRLQVNNTNFGNGTWPYAAGNQTCTATGNTTTIGNVRYYLTGANKRGYRLINSCIINTGNNGWTATGIAP